MFIVSVTNFSKKINSIFFKKESYSNSLLKLSPALFFGAMTYYLPGSPLTLLVILTLFWSLDEASSWFCFFLRIWIFYTFIFYGVTHGLVFFIQESLNISIPFATLIFIIFGAIHELLFASVISLSYLLSNTFKLNKISRLLLTILITFVSRKILPVLIPMNLATTLSGGNFFLKHLFSIFGVDAIELLVMLYILVILIIFKRGYLKDKRSTSILLISLTFITSSLFILANYEKKQWKSSNRSLKIAFYQPGKVWESGESVTLRYNQELEDLEKLEIILSKLPDLDFLVLPETFFFSNVNTKSSQIALLQDTVDKYNIPILSGGRSVDKKMTGNYNNVFFMNKNGKVISEYYKRKLMPIGEYKPLRDSFPQISEHLPGNNRYLSGKDSAPLTFYNKYRIGLAICYEDVWEEFYREFSFNNSDFVVSVSSDNQFYSRVFAQNHLNVAFSHALSMRLPMLRVTNTGISAALNAEGKILSKTQNRVEELRILELKLPKKKSKSFFYRYNFWQFIIFVLALCFTIVFIEKRRS